MSGGSTKTITETLQDTLDSVEETYPLILKTLRGSKGIGVIFIESRRQLESIIPLLWDETHYGGDTELLLQTYIKTDHDVRGFVFCHHDLVISDFG